MKHLAAYCLLVLSGKQNPTEEEVAKLLKDVGVNPDKEAISSMFKAVNGRKLNELVN